MQIEWKEIGQQLKKSPRLRTKGLITPNCQDLYQRKHNKTINLYINYGARREVVY